MVGPDETMMGMFGSGGMQIEVLSYLTAKAEGITIQATRMIMAAAEANMPTVDVCFASESD